MLTVKASVKVSPIHGLGLFADEPIAKGTPTWIFDPRFDICFDSSEVRAMSSQQRNLIERYAHLSKVSGRYVYSIDDSRFMNHSVEANNCEVIAGEFEPRTVANRDIAAGEELTENYRDIDSNDAVSTESYLDS